MNKPSDNKNIHKAACGCNSCGKGKNVDVNSCGKESCHSCCGCCGGCGTLNGAGGFSLKGHKDDIIRIAAGGTLFAAGLLLKALGAGMAAAAALLFAYAVCGFVYIIKAFENISKGKIFDENFLMALATAGAIALGEYAEAAAVMLFYSVGEFLQELAVSRTRKSITQLMDLRPEYANVILNGVEKRADPADIRAGDIIIIKPGEKVPADCTVISGSAYMDTASLTGESVPKRAQEGSLLYSGMVDTNGVLTARVNRPSSESAASRVLKLVENSMERKAKAENFITKFAKVYTPAVVTAAAALAVLPPLFLGYAFSEWLYRALVFLIISCPCAVVISVPLGFFGGIGGSSKRGILFKGANYLDALAETDIMVLDKTGTVTKGTFSVVKVLPEKENGKEELLRLAAIAEKYSSHPIALSLKERYKGEIENAEVKNYKEISGKGVIAEYGGKTLCAGNASLMEGRGIKYAQAEGFGTTVYVAADNEYLGCIVIADEIKQEAYSLISGLKSEGIQKVIMLTGDNEKSAKHTAAKIGADEYYSGLMPDGKVKAVEKIKSVYNGKKVAFAGDGINDAPVLARSDVGIAMGAMGSGAAIEAADVVLLNDNVKDIITAIRAAKRTRKIVTQNIIFSIGFKVLIMALGLLGIADIWMAVFADVGVALLAVANSARALAVKHL